MKKPLHKLHILFFTDTQIANPKKPKEQFFANACTNGIKGININERNRQRTNCTLQRT